MGVLANRVRVNTTTTGTGTITLGSAVAGYQTFTAGGITDGDVVSYVIVDNGNAWEVGEGTYGAGGNTLTRTVTESSNSDAALNLSGGAQVFIAARAEDFPAELTQVQVEDNASTVFGQVSGQRLSQAIDANVGAATAGLAFGAVGTYAMLVHATVDQVITAGSTYAGSSLRPTGFSTNNASTLVSGATLMNGGLIGSTLSGTWRAMGALGSVLGHYDYRGTLFKRIS